MKNKAYKKTVFSLIIFSCWLVSNGQQKNDSLFSYLEIAAKNNPSVLQRFYEYEAAMQKVPQVGSLPDPNVSLGIFIKPMEFLGGDQLAQINLMQMFPWFGVLKSAKDEMSLMAKAKYELFLDAKLQVFYNVQRTWYELHKVKQNICISEKNIEILQMIERLTIVRFKASSTPTSSSGKVMTSVSAQNNSSGNSGMQSMGGNNSFNSVSNQSSTSMQSNSMSSSSGVSSLSDVYRIQIEIGELQNNIEFLKSQWNTLSAQFNNYLNRKPDATVTISDSLIAGNFQPSPLALSDSSFGNNPMLGMLQYEQQSLDARKQMVTKMGYPMIGLGVNYSVFRKSEMSISPMNDGSDMIMPMVSATLPIYRKKYNAMRKETDLLKSATEQNYKAVSNELKTEYYQAMQLYKDALRRNKLYGEQFILASKSLDIMFKSFASSGTNLTDILRVRQQTLDYEYRQIEAIADLNISIAWFKRLTAF